MLVIKPEIRRLSGAFRSAEMVTFSKLPFLAFLGASLLAIRFASRIPRAPAFETVKISLSYPLEFKTALIFSLLFVILAAVTSIVIARYGSGGLRVLSSLLV